MRNMSFALTTAQIRRREKTVTRRAGWTELKPGTLLQPVVKSQGLKKGERVETIGRPIRVINVRREPLYAMPEADCALEGFAELSAAEFVTMFARTHGCTADTLVTRIEFEYVEPA